VPKPIADTELIAAIVEALKPWAPQWRQIETGPSQGFLTEIPIHEVEHIIGDYVRERIDSLRITTPNFFSRDAIINKREGARESSRRSIN
jgi:hypothetical protein